MINSVEIIKADFGNEPETLQFELPQDIMNNTNNKFIELENGAYLLTTNNLSSTIDITGIFDSLNTHQNTLLLL